MTLRRRSISAPLLAFGLVLVGGGRAEGTHGVAGLEATESAARQAPDLRHGDGPADYHLIRTDLRTEPIRLATLDRTQLEHVHAEEGWKRVAMNECLGLFHWVGVDDAPSRGLLVLADGQRFPGQPALGGDTGEDVVAWTHPIFGRLSVPIDLVSSMQLLGDPMEIDPGDEGAVLLANGDRLDGFIIALGDPVSLEVDGAIVDVPLDRVIAVGLVTPDRIASGQRLWLRDGTVIDVDETIISDDQVVRLTSRWLASEAQQEQIQIEGIVGLRFEPNRLLALASIEPSRVEGPPNRFAVSVPEIVGEVAPLELHDMSFRGPITVHYAVPPGTRRFAAEASLPASHRRWGDFELQVLDEGRPVFRAHVSADQPSVSINVPIEGSELTIRMTEGRFGAVQDALLLRRAMLLVQ